MPVWGFLAALGSAIFFGLNATATKVLYAPDTPSHTDPLGLIAARSVWTLPLFFALAFAAFPRGRRRPSAKEIGLFIVSGICYGPATTGMYALGVGHTSAAHAVLLMSLAAPLASILAVVLLHERLQPTRVVALVIGVIGGAALTFSRSTSGSSPYGDGMILVMVAGWAIMAMAMRVLNRTYSPLFVAAAMGTLGSLILVGLSALTHRLGEAQLPLRYHDLRTVLAFDLELVLLLSIVGQMLQSVALRILGVALVSLISGYGSIFFGLLGSFVILHERFSPWGIVAGCLLLIALALALIEPQQVRRDSQLSGACATK